MTDQEELDYYIMFPSFPVSPKDPTITSAMDNQDRRDDFVFVYEEDKRPVVVLLGWAGCQDKYLAKYSAIYEEKSCITLRYTAPVDCLFLRRDKMPYIGKRLVQVLLDKSLGEHPIFFHIFSNGGAFLYEYVSVAMQQAGSPFQVKGVIFDSAPGERRVLSLYRAISAIIGGHPLTNIPMSFVITFFLSVIWIVEIFIQSSLRKGKMMASLASLAEEPYSCPQLFLYSNTDTLISSADVEKFATRRAERGVKVEMVLFTDSPHVKHFTTYRDVYVNTVCNFVNESLRIKQKTIEGNNDGQCIDDDDVNLIDTQGLTKRVVLPHEATKQ